MPGHTKVKAHTRKGKKVSAHTRTIKGAKPKPGAGGEYEATARKERSRENGSLLLYPYDSYGAKFSGEGSKAMHYRINERGSVRHYSKGSGTGANKNRSKSSTQKYAAGYDRQGKGNRTQRKHAKQYVK